MSLPMDEIKRLHRAPVNMYACVYVTEEKVKTVSPQEYRNLEKRERKNAESERSEKKRDNCGRV